MSVLAIACDNCGAKYRLPESFSGDKAKCQKCGSVIDVAAQRKAAAAPAPVAQPKAAPAPKEETVAKKPAARASRTEAKAEAAPAARSRRGDKAAAEPKAEKAPRGRKEAGEREPKKSNTMLLAGGGIAALAIVAVIVVLASGGKDKAKATETAQASAAPKAQETPAATPKDASTDKPVAAEASAKSKPAAVEAAVTPAIAPAAEQKPADQKPAAQKPAESKPAEQKPVEPTPAQPKAEEKPAEATPAANSGAPKERWEANKTTKLDDVYNPSVLGDVSWPAECEQAQKDEIVSLIEDVCNGGKPGISAKPKLEKIGYYAIFGIVDRLRKFDYKSGDEQMTAYEFNQMLETITSGINCGFVPVESGGDLDPRKADHNARTNDAWTRLLTKFDSKAAFDTWKKERQSKSK
jgi:hypothetical protein